MKADHQRAWTLIRHLYPQLDLDQLCFSEHSLRFELGDVQPNGSTRRIEQAVARGAALFESCFTEDMELVVLIQTWDSGQEMLPTTPAGYLEQMIPEMEGRLVILPLIDAGEGDIFQPETSIMQLAKSRLNVEGILRGKANLEMGRSPSINQSVCFVGIKSGLVFYMYDDRGCLIYAQTKRELAALRRQYGAWLVSPGRVCGN